MKIAIPKEILPGERRVAATPETVDKMVKGGLEVWVESDAGQAAFFSNGDYEKVGAKIAPDAASVYSDADIVIKIQRPLQNEKVGKDEVELMKEGAILVALLQPMSYPEIVQKLAARKVTSFSVDLIPRITRAQRMDVLSSMSSIAGYKAVLLAASAFGKLIPMMTTAAGTLPPAKVLIIGAGVAGLQAIATAKRLGAQVEAFDTRPAVKEQVKSLGAEFVELELGHEQAEDAGGYAKELSAEFYKKEKELIHQHVKAADIVITTALIPGKKAPVLITTDMVKEMKKGSVIVDMAVEQGGNCELSKVGQEVVEYGVTIVGATNLPSSVPIHASQMYAKNMHNFLFHLYVNKELKLDLNDEITKGAMVTHKGEIVNSKVKEIAAKG
ncbi:MAG: Re/Si-specific NAD(P)(+) transhydrogenase subunit alpha [Nitrospirae bacterium]|nr:Re/Si-specific NAD(P)(+) transhydrogenase subunit alpha [Candidatus Manganitrophaceae bacterium]